MNWLDRVLVTTFPTLLLQSTPWLREWTDRERADNVAIWRVVFPLVGAIYIGHLLLFDIPQGLEPLHLWESFRLSVAGVSWATFLFYCVPALYGSKSYKAPAILTCWLLCYTQAQTALWYDDSQYLYAFAFVAVSSILIRLGVIGSILFATLTIASQWNLLRFTGISFPVLYSASIATLTFVFVSRSRYSNDVRYFLATHQNAASQKRLIELNIDFTDRIRAFLPLEISHRLNEKLADSASSVLHVIDDVLRPEERPISCLFSDIRGFTRKSKQSLSFVAEGVLPNLKMTTSIIEQNAGVPRKIGDLVFAYFDDLNPYSNLIRCLQSGLSLIAANQLRNERNSPELEIKRYVLISSGRAIVGNIGGFDSSIEITALGSPVNLLSRMDELTKHPEFQKRARETDLILCAASAELLARLGVECTVRELRLDSLGIRVRDFEEMSSLWILPWSNQNFEVIQAVGAHLTCSSTSGKPK